LKIYATNNQFLETNWFDQKISKTAGKLHIAYNPVKKKFTVKFFLRCPFDRRGEGRAKATMTGINRPGARHGINI
jgi:hypothetical protein